MTSNRGQLPHAPRWRGAWTSCAIWKGLMARRPRGSTGPRARGRHWLHARACVYKFKRYTVQSGDLWGKKTHTHIHTGVKKITHMHGRNSNNAIRDSLMIFEGRVCGLSLIFPLPLLIPQSLLQRKKPSRAAREPRKTEWKNERG